MAWFGNRIFSANKESMILSKCLIKSLLLVIAFEEKYLWKVIRGYPEPRGNLEQIQICFIKLPLSSKEVNALTLRSYTAITLKSE